MNYFLLNILLALTWAMLNGEVSIPNLLTGFVLAYLVLVAAQRALPSSSYMKKGWLGIRFFLFFLWEMLVSNLLVAFDVITPGHDIMRPRIIAIPLDVKTDFGVTALANFISLTPGTLILDIAKDRKTMYVHVMFGKDEEQVRRHIKEKLEKMVIGLFEEA